MNVFVRVICFGKALTWVSLEGSYKCFLSFNLDDLVGLAWLFYTKVSN